MARPVVSRVWSAALGLFFAPAYYYRTSRVRVPEAVAALSTEVLCYRFKAAEPASCAEPLS